MSVRLGYSYWGFLGDNKLDALGNELSTPDGNATYSYSIIHEAHSRGWKVYRMQEDRDRPAVEMYGSANFEAFSLFERYHAHKQMLDTNGRDYPELDVLLLEWRFPIPGRNCKEVRPDGVPVFPMSMDGYQLDLERQYDLLEHYSQRNTKIIIWDLDHKVEVRDEKLWRPHAIFETSHAPRELTQKRTKVEFPTLVRNLLEHPTLPPDPYRKMVYVGSRYERDDVIREYLEPLSKLWPDQIEFWGNWTREPNLSECKAMWPDFSYNGRITTSKFRSVYSTAVCCPLLAKRSYIETGFITPRPYEALQFGTIPVGLTQMKGIDNYVLYHGANAEALAENVKELTRMKLAERDRLRRKNVELIEHMDARYFVDKIQEVLDVGTSVR